MISGSRHPGNAKVLIVTPEFPPQIGGIGKHCYEMAKHWGRKVDVTVLTVGVAGTQATLDLPVSVVELRPVRSRLRRLWRTYREISRLLAINMFDIVYIAHWRRGGVAFRLAAMRRRRAPRYVQAIHGGEVLYLMTTGGQAVSRLLFRWTISHADKVVALGQYQAELLDRLGVRRERVFVSPEGVDVSTFQRSDSQDWQAKLRRRHGLEGKRVLLTVARLAPHKGHDIVIRALPGILARVPDAAYLIAGSGSREGALRRLVDEIGVAEHVHFVGFVPDDELAQYYYLCDVFVMPTRELNGDTEGFGIVFAEAAACGKPTVGGRTGGILEAIQEGKTGLLVEPTSSAELADAVVTLLTNKELAQRLGEAGRARVIKDLQYKDIAANILAACGVRAGAPGAAA